MRLRAERLLEYRDVGIDHPFVFVLGLPRSGTTLTSQLLAYCLDAGYVNNGLMVLAPGAFVLLGIIVWIQRSISGYSEK